MVVCLVLANIGYYLWTRGIAATPGAPLPGPPAATLKLAYESSDAGKAPASIANGGAAMGSGDAVGGGTSAASGTASGNAGGFAGGNADVGGGEASHEAAPAGLLTNVKRCISVGPFREVTEAAHAASTLRAAHYDPRQRAAEGEVWAGVWVYLPLPVARGAGDQMLAKLKSGGIDDALEMPGPTEGSVISLGLYSEPKRAQARVAQAQALGFNPGIADRKRTGNVYWIDIDLKPTDGLLNPADLQNEAGRIVRLEVKGCPSVSGAAP